MDAGRRKNVPDPVVRRDPGAKLRVSRKKVPGSEPQPGIWHVFPSRPEQRDGSVPPCGSRRKTRPQPEERDRIRSVAPICHVPRSGSGAARDVPHAGPILTSSMPPFVGRRQTPRAHNPAAGEYLGKPLRADAFRRKSAAHGAFRARIQLTDRLWRIIPVVPSRRPGLNPRAPFRGPRQRSHPHSLDAAVRSSPGKRPGLARAAEPGTRPTPPTARRTARSRPA